MKINGKVSLSFLLALTFFAFFQYTKQAPALRAINPFGEDPFDAVGSFAIQLAFACALWAGWSAFISQPASVAKATRLIALSILVTLAADLVAIFARLSLWKAQPGGLLLLALTMGYLLGVLAISAATGALRGLPRKDLGFALAVSLASVLLLAVFPPGFSQSLAGGVAAALLGMLLFFINVWAWAGRPPLAHRRLPLIFTIGLLAGLALLAVEVVAEGGTNNLARLALVASVFLGVEGLGVLAGYVLLGNYLFGV